MIACKPVPPTTTYPLPRLPPLCGRRPDQPLAAGHHDRHTSPTRRTGAITPAARVAAAPAGQQTRPVDRRGRAGGGGGAGLPVFRPGRVADAGQPEIQPRQPGRAVPAASVVCGGCIFCGVCGGHRAVFPRCCGADAGGGRDVRPVGGPAGGVVCVQPGRLAGVSGGAAFAARHGAGAFRQTTGADQRRHGPRRRDVPADAAPGAAVSVFHGQPADGADADHRHPLLQHQPAWHVCRHGGICECRHPVGRHPQPARCAVARPAAQLCAAGRISADRQGGGLGPAAAQGVCTLDQAGHVRAQPGGDRRRRRWPGQRLHCRRRQGQGHLG